MHVLSRSLPSRQVAVVPAMRPGAVVGKSASDSLAAVGQAEVVLMDEWSTLDIAVVVVKALVLLAIWWVMCLRVD